MKLSPTAAVIALVPALLGGLCAQKPTKNVLGKSDTEFARALLREGYTDLATALSNLILEHKSTDTIGIEALQLEMKLEDAKREADPIKRKDLLIENLKARAAFTGKYASSKEAGEVRIGLPDLYRRLGEAVETAIKDATPEKVAELKKEAGELFTQAENTFKAKMEALKEEREAEDKAIEFLEAFYNLARTYYFHSKLEPKGSFEKNKLLEKAIETFQEFDLEFGDRLVNFECFVYTGLAYKDLGKVDEAVESFNGAIDLRERFGGKDAKGVYKIDEPAAVEIICAAYIQKVLLYTELKDYEKAIAAAKEYQATMPGALDVSNGPQLLYVQGKAHQEAGDDDAAKAIAQRIIDRDPNGPWASLGRALLADIVIRKGGGGTLDPRQYINLAVAAFENGQTGQAMQLCHRAVGVARGTDKEAEIGLEAYITIGAMFARQQWWHEAALAFDVAAERFGGAPNAGDALWRAIQCYMQINGEEKNAYYKRKIDQRRESFIAKYPKHPNAPDVQLIEAEQAMAQRDYATAISLFLKVPASARIYHHAQVRASEAHVAQARNLLREKKNAEAQKLLDAAEGMLKKARAEIPGVLKENVDAQYEEQLKRVEFRARTLLADVYLASPDTTKAAAVSAVFDNLDAKTAAEPENATIMWRYQIRALEAQGKVDEAVSFFEGWLQKKPDERIITGPAGLLATALDEAGTELEKKNDKRGAEEKFRKAVRFYELKLKPLVANQQSMSPADKKVIDRIYVLGLKMNNVPDAVNSFVDAPRLELKEKGILQKAADLYDAYLKSAPSLEAQITVGRIHGFLKQWREAADAYGRLFADANNDVVDRSVSGGALRTDVLSARPVLLPAYLEWGVALREVALRERARAAAQAKDDEQRAIDVLSRISASPQLKDTKIWWQARYFLIRTLADRGEYDTAKIAIRSLERTNPDFGGKKHGLEQEWQKLRDELK
jgi:tetratricopeptide (TPR) repeat protein